MNHLRTFEAYDPEEQRRNVIANRPFHRDIVMRHAEDVGAVIINEDTLYLYHGTSMPNARKIMRTEMFLNHTFFSHDPKIAHRYATSVSRGKSHVFDVPIYAGALVVTGGYFTLNEAVYLDPQDKVYKPKDLFL